MWEVETNGHRGRIRPPEVAVRSSRRKTYVPLVSFTLKTKRDRAMVSLQLNTNRKSQAAWHLPWSSVSPNHRKGPKWPLWSGGNVILLQIGTILRACTVRTLVRDCVTQPELGTSVSPQLGSGYWVRRDLVKSTGIVDDQSVPFLTGELMNRSLQKDLPRN